MSSCFVSFFCALSHHFVGFYTTWLWIATIVGTIATIFWVLGRFVWENDVGVWANSVYSVFLALWGKSSENAKLLSNYCLCTWWFSSDLFLLLPATFFLEYWKRKNHSLNHQWGTTNYEQVERERAEYTGTEKRGIYYHGEWIPWLETDQEVMKNIMKAIDENPSSESLKGPMNKYYPSPFRSCKIGAALPVIAFMVIFFFIFQA